MLQAHWVTSRDRQIIKVGQQNFASFQEFMSLIKTVMIVTVAALHMQGGFLHSKISQRGKSYLNRTSCEDQVWSCQRNQIQHKDSSLKHTLAQTHVDQFVIGR